MGDHASELCDFRAGLRRIRQCNAKLIECFRVREHAPGKPGEELHGLISRWVLPEIADYSSRLLLAPGDADAQAHAWQALQPYLPIPHAAIASARDAVLQKLAPFVRIGQVNLRTKPP